jgi:hypothetical protein
MTYGAHPVVHEVLRRASGFGITTLYTLHRSGYEDRWWFQYADNVLTCSEYLRDHYEKAIGLRSTGIASPIAWSEALAPADTREFLTFVNPPEIQPWYDTITKLWDDTTAYSEAATRARQTAVALYDENQQRKRFIDHVTSLKSGNNLFIS